MREAAEYYRDVLGFTLDPVDGVFQASPDEPGGVYAIVKRPGAWIHLQIRRRETPREQRPGFERDVYLYVNDVDGLHAVSSAAAPGSSRRRGWPRTNFVRWSSRFSTGTDSRSGRS